MFQIINWLCLIAISFLVVEIMVYFCKDAINIFNGIGNARGKVVGNAKVGASKYVYENKIAK